MSLFSQVSFTESKVFPKDIKNVYAHACNPTFTRSEAKYLRINLHCTGNTFALRRGKERVLNKTWPDMSPIPGIYFLIWNSIFPIIVSRLKSLLRVAFFVTTFCYYYYYYYC